MTVDADAVKARARALGVDLVGIASADALNTHPPDPRVPRTPRDILPSGKSVVVLAKRTLRGAARLSQWNNRSDHYAHELALTHLEEVAIEVVWFLEEHGYPSIVLPAAMSRSHQHEQTRLGPLSLPHAAVEAGLGTLGLNGMLVTQEFGPRIILGGLITMAELLPDTRLTDALCKGEACGRCLLACPAGAVLHWDLDESACRKFSAPWGYDRLARHASEIAAEATLEARMQKVASMDTFMLWQSMLRGVGVYTGCHRCADVCPVGDDYKHIEDAVDAIPEATADKHATLAEYRRRRAAGAAIGRLREQARWTGALAD